MNNDKTQALLIERGGLVIASLVAHSWGGEAAITVGDLIAEIQRIDELEEKINLAHACLNNRNEMILSMKGENEKLNAVLDTIEKTSYDEFICKLARTRGGSDESK